MGEEPTWLPIAFEARTPSRGRGTRWQVVRCDVPFALRTAEEGDAPRSIRARWLDAAALPSRMIWRAFDGALWRPVVGPAGEVLDGRDEFVRAAGFPLAGPWPDYPLSGDPNVSASRLRRLYGASIAPDCLARTECPELDTAVAEARAMARDSLLVVDGVVHRRAPPPRWAVTERGREPNDPLSVFLEVPDFPRTEPLAVFELDRFGEAQTYAFRLAAEAGDPGLRFPLDGHVGVEAVQVGWMPQVFPDEHAFGYRTLLARIDRDLAGVHGTDLPAGFKDALARLRVVAGGLAAAVAGPNALPEAEDAVRWLAGSDDPGGGSPNRQVATAVRRARERRWRDEERERAYAREDANALASLDLASPYHG